MLKQKKSPRPTGISHLLCTLCQKVLVRLPQQELIAQAGFPVSLPQTTSLTGSGPSIRHLLPVHAGKFHSFPQLQFPHVKHGDRTTHFAARLCELER